MVADANVPATVLVVDDDADLRDVLMDALSEDYAVLAAESADAAVALLIKTAVDFVVSDVRMPGTMDGFGLASWLQANRPNTPALLITGYSESTMRELPDDLPLWRKPFASGELLNYIQRVLTAAPCCRA